MCIRDRSIAGKYKNAVFALLGIAIVVFITYFNPATKGGVDVSIDTLNIGDVYQRQIFSI